jgi:hypothetical protein
MQYQRDFANIAAKSLLESYNFVLNWIKAAECELIIVVCSSVHYYYASRRLYILGYKAHTCLPYTYFLCPIYIVYIPPITISYCTNSYAALRCAA